MAKSKPEEAVKRRVRAGRLLLAGKSPPEVARMVGAPRQTVYRWRDVLNVGGIDALRDMSKGGRPAQLGAAGVALCGAARGRAPVRYAAVDAQAGGCYRTRIRRAVQRSPRLALARAAGFVRPKPDEHALERDAAAIAHWRKRTWPALKKTPLAKED